MKHRITLIPGDGTGPEICEAVIKVVDSIAPRYGVAIEWETAEAGESALKKYGTPLPAETIESIRRNKVALKGPVTTPIGTGFRSVNVAIRHELDLFACLRPCKTYRGVKSRYSSINLVVVRENTEDLYAGVEFDPGSPEAESIAAMGKGKIRKGSAISVKPISYEASERIVRFAFDYAAKRGRKKVTAVTKANIMKASDGLFLKAARDVAQKYPDVEFDEKLIDNMCMQLVMKPELYDVLVLPNLYGDIISDLCAGLIGGLGIAPGANFGNDCAVFEAVHGSAPKYKGLNKVNPSAVLLSAALMLEYIGEKEMASKIEAALAAVIKEGVTVTYDLGGAAGTSEMAEAVIDKWKELA
jgi:isocitrate dehydrogenase (NAD+)